MRSGRVMVLKILRQDAAQVMLVQDDDVIQTFAADRADEASPERERERPDHRMRPGPAAPR